MTVIIRNNAPTTAKVSAAYTEALALENAWNTGRIVPVTMGNCSGGGDHVPGQSGQWAGRCVKCGQPC